MTLRSSFILRIVAASLGCVGVGLVVVGLAADYIGLGEPEYGFGSTQWFMCICGVGILGTGMILWKAIQGNQIARQVLLFSGVTIVMVLVVDIVGRFWLPFPTPGYRAWAAYPRSGLLLKLDPDEFEAMHRYNRVGFRGAEFSIDRGETPFRIACVGDSYTEGVGASEEGAWPSVLGRELAGLGGEVLNLGDAGSGPDRYAQICSKVAFGLQPTDVVVCFNPSDFRRGSDARKAIDTVPKFTNPFHDRPSGLRALSYALPTWLYLLDSAQGKWPVQRGLYWHTYSNQNYDRAVEWIAQEERVSRQKARKLASERLKEIEPKVLTAAKKGHFNAGLIQLELVKPHYYYRIRVEDMGIARKDLEECVDDWMKWFASHCRSFDIRPSVLYFPHAPQVMEGPFGPYTDEFYEQSPHSQSVVGERSFATLLGKICREHEVEFIDVTDVLLRHNDRRLYFRYDCHPNALAYEIVGKHVAEQMRRRF